MLAAVIDNPYAARQKTTGNTFLAPTQSEFLNVLDSLGGLAFPLFSAKPNARLIEDGFLLMAKLLQRVNWAECDPGNLKNGWHRIQVRVTVPGLNNVTVLSRKRIYW